jgi:hypothetical protein
VLNAKLKPISDEERSAHRFRLLLQASAGITETGLVDVSIHDLSATGFLLECDESIQVGTEVSLEIPSVGSALGDVVWTSGRFSGGEFRTPLPSSAIASARSTSRVVWPDFAQKSAANREPEPLLPVIQDQTRAAAAMAIDDRLPLARRMQIIVGASILLWTPLALGIWTALG